MGTKSLIAIALTIGVAVLNVGCATSSKIITADGTQGISINCSGNALTWGDCYQKAGDQCPHGYNILNKDESAASSVSIFGGGQFANRNLLITCKA